MRAIDCGELEKRISSLARLARSDAQKSLLGRVLYIVENMPTITPPNEWVSVDERLPGPDFPGQQRGFYLVALFNGTVEELMYEFRHYENAMFDVGWHETAFPVTHWMLLPAPPEHRLPKTKKDSDL